MNMKSLCAAVAVGMAVALSNAAPAPSAPVPVTYIMVCCHEKDKGTKFLANGEWPEKRDYRKYPIALDTLRKIKETGIGVVGIDFTNMAQWDVSASTNHKHVNEATKDDPNVYYNIVKEEIAKWRKQQPVRK